MLTRDQWLARHESRALRYESFRWDEVRVRAYGDAAVVTGRETVRGKYEDYDVQDQFRATLVLVRQQALDAGRASSEPHSRETLNAGPAVS